MKFTFFALSLALACSLGSAFAGPGVPAFKKVMIILFENEDAQSVMNSPSFRTFATTGANLTNMTAETHPSQANYVALISGDTQGVTGDQNVNISAHHIGDLLEAAGRNWKIYLEGYPGNCFTGASVGNYVRKHNPFISFLNIQTNPTRCNQHLVGAGEIDKDIANGTLPDYSIYVPDLRNDGHDTGLAFADSWFKTIFFPILKDQRFMQDMLVVATFDESHTKSANSIYTAFYGDAVIPQSSSNLPYNHYSLLRTIEDVFGLGTLGLRDRAAAPIQGIWR
jgi:hypothetical protein